MKFIHLSDLHLGMRLRERSMIEDQEYILAEILKVIDKEAPDGVLIAGDVYDKSVPSAEAVGLLDDFLTRLSRRDLQVFVISGNHDSPERMAFGARLMDKSGIHVAGGYEGMLAPFEMTDEYGKVRVYLLPFVKPAHVRRWFPEEEIGSYTDALRVALSGVDADPSVRKILVTHQFVTGATRSDSEEVSVGGTDNVDAAVFDGFDYVALGHIHSPQNCGADRIRYCGTPLKYSFSEAKDQKSVTVAELGAKGDLSVRTVPLTPLRDLAEIKGNYADLTLKSFYENTTLCEDYLHITLTDEEDIVDAVGKLRAIYRNLLRLDYDNTRTRTAASVDGVADVETKSPLELFSELYELQNNQPMSGEQADFIKTVIEAVWEEEA